MTEARQRQRRATWSRWWPRLLLGVVVVAPAAAIMVYARLPDAPPEGVPGEAMLQGSAPAARGQKERASAADAAADVATQTDMEEDAERAPATPEERCAASEECRRDGMCRLLEDELGARCGIEAHADCAETQLCREQQRCHFAPTGFGGEGRCVEAELVRSQRFPLTTKRHGIQGELLLMVDPLMAKRPAKAARGYWPDPESPRVAAALTLRDVRGTLVDEVTLYPDVTVKVEDLGAGTDTFLATEHLGCPAGHWCGPSTVFLEVRDGRLSRISALGPRGEERAMIAAASSGARWKLERNARLRTRDLVVQVESFVPPGPALLETRFTFSRGRFRFTERKWPEFLPKNAKLPGPWLGDLVFHREPG